MCRNYQKVNIKSFLVLALFALAGTLSFFCRTERHAQEKSVNLRSIPTVVGEWRMVTEKTSLGTKEEKFLDEVLVRAYQRSDGKIVQLAIAYGADQRKNFSIHLPEVCLNATGYSVRSIGQATIDCPKLTLKQLLAKNPEGSVEAVQYWIALGGKIVTSDFDWKLKHAYYGAFGSAAGGILARVSSLAVGADYNAEYEIQKKFLSSLNRSVKKNQQRLLFGG